VVSYKEIAVIVLSPECVVFYKEIAVIALFPECVVLLNTAHSVDRAITAVFLCKIPHIQETEQ
jgi:hypothetical protein